MSSGGGKTQTTTSNNAPPAWAVPYFHQGLQMASRTANQPFQQFEGPMVAGQTADQQAAAGMVRGLAADNSALNRGSSFAQGLLGGQGQFRPGANPYEGDTARVGNNQYIGATTNVGSNQFMGSNPYLGNMIDQSTRDVTDAYNRSVVPGQMAQFNSGGAFGGTAHLDAMNQSQQSLAQELGDLSNQYRFQDYQTQQQMAESDLNRRLQAQQTDLARNAGLTEAGLDRSLGAQQTDLARNAGLADSRLARDQSAWDSYQGRQLSALGMIPGLDQARYYGAQQLGQQGLQQQLTNQAGIDASYDEFLRGQGWNQQQMGSLAQMLGTIQGGTSSTTGANPNYRSAGQNALTAAAIAAAFMV